MWRLVGAQRLLRCSRQLWRVSARRARRAEVPRDRQLPHRRPDVCFQRRLLLGRALCSRCGGAAPMLVGSRWRRGVRRIGWTCTITGDCCPGTGCIVPGGSILGTCGVVTPPVIGSDGGAPGGDSGVSTDSGAAPDGASSTDSGPVSEGGKPSSDGGESTDGGASAVDASTPPPPVCSQYGQICASATDCCNAIPCSAGVCRIPPM